jgi:putative glutamine amidotransferase
MKRTAFLLLLLAVALNCFPQDYPHEDFKKNKHYVVLMDPTVGNIQTIQYLLSKKILNIKEHKVKFVGVYYKGQAYDFSKSGRFLKENKAKNFSLLEVQGNLDEKNLYIENGTTTELKNIFDHSVGVIFFGGPDIPPSVYGEENTYSEVTDPNRHYFELTFLYHLLGGSQDENYKPWLEEKPKYLVTGFCLGMQTMNVATGGTLIQDIPAQVYNAHGPKETLDLIARNNLHRNYWQEIVKDSLLMGINLHKIRFSENDFFGKTIKIDKKIQPRVCSSHHQAAGKLGKNLEITALSVDGKIIEGLVHAKYHNVFAVQFHPEVPGLYEDLYKRKFHPDDTPMSYYGIIGKKSVKFHKIYWKHISDIINGKKR